MTKPLKRFWRNNNLSIVVLGIFFVILVGMSLVGWKSNNNDLTTHKQQTTSYGEYLVSGEFAEGVFENWESEFLQMWALVILTIYLRQKGSSESKPVRGKQAQDNSSRYAIINAATWRTRKKAIGHTLYAHSLGLTLLAMFIVSILLHVWGGTSAYNSEAQAHGEAQYSVLQFAGSAEFWYQSLQNWQSEFLAVGALLLLTIKLRERGSEQSKPVGKRYDSKTGA
jgi:hypothetical protein